MDLGEIWASEEANVLISRHRKGKQMAEEGYSDSNPEGADSNQMSLECLSEFIQCLIWYNFRVWSPVVKYWSRQQRRFSADCNAENAMNTQLTETKQPDKECC